MNIDKESAFKGIYASFRDLIEKGLSNHEIELIGDFPVLTIEDPINLYIDFWHLSNDYPSGFHIDSSNKDLLSRIFDYNKFESFNDKFKDDKILVHFL